MVYHSPARDLYTRVHFNFTRRVLSARIQDPAAAPAADKIPAPGSRPTGTSNRPGQSRPSGNGTGAARSVGQSAGPGNSRTGGGSRPGGNANRQRPQGGGGRHTKGRKNFNKSESKEENSESEIEVEGTICAVLAGTMFKVRLPNGHEVLAHISGKMRKRFIKIVVGDKVRMEMSPYDMTKARITFRIG